MNLNEAKAAVRRWFNGEFYDWFRDANVGETLTLEVASDNFSAEDVKQIANVLYALEDEMFEESFDDGVSGRFYDSERGGYVEGRLMARIIPDMGGCTALNYADGVLKITVGVTEVYSKTIDGDYSEISSGEYYDLLSEMDPDEEYEIELGMLLLADIQCMLEEDE